MAHKICPNCGNDIENDEAHGLCPVCLLEEGMKSQRSEPAGEGDPLRQALETRFQGQYRLIRLLGRGGMGAVYLGRDLALEREVAIKVVKTTTDEREIYERFRREAKTAAKLSHPNIVPLHAFGEVEGMPYFVMGYVRGESLADRLRRDGKLSEEDARRILAEIASALDHAHRQGVIHRDIKPDNVLLDDESGRALLTDFGVAKGLGKSETLTRHGTVLGTPYYMSPEQASGRGDIDGRSDIYSLGVMGYTMLAGRLPFDGNAADVLAKHLTQEPAPLTSFASVSDVTAQTVHRCLAKDPGARWPDARSLALALGNTEENRLPDALQAVEGQGILGVVIALLLLLIVRLTNPPREVLALNAGIVLTIYAVVLIRLRLEGFSLTQSQRAIWTEPSWWTFWYPRALRRRGNVWERLPRVVRQVRSWVLIQLIWFVLLFFGDFPNLYRHPTTFAIKVGGLAGMVVVWDILILRARRALKRKGLTAADNRQVVISMPASRVSFFARPHIAAILAPATQPDVTRRVDSPHDHLQSILRYADELSGPLRALGGQAAVAARHLVASIEEADRQIADLARSLEPGEDERLAEKIEALADIDQYAPMRSLLEKQRELVREMSARIEEAKDRRSRRAEMLKTLALHLATLRARSTPTPSEVRLLSDNVRALCDAIERQAATLGDAQTGINDQVSTVSRTPSA